MRTWREAEFQPLVRACLDQGPSRTPGPIPAPSAPLPPDRSLPSGAFSGAAAPAGIWTAACETLRQGAQLCRATG